jgi:hypothetical protein
MALKRLTSFVFLSHNLSFSDTCLEFSHWSSTVSASLVLIGPFLQTSLLAPDVYIYGPSEAQLIRSALKMETAHFSETLPSTNQ